MRNGKSFCTNLEKQFIFSCTILTDSEKYIGKTPVCLEQYSNLINEIINEMLFINFCKYAEILLVVLFGQQFIEPTVTNLS